MARRVNPRPSGAVELEHWRSSCFGKRAYGSRRMANQVVRRLLEQGRRELSAYRCRWCRLFHTGHTPIAEMVRRLVG